MSCLSLIIYRHVYVSIFRTINQPTTYCALWAELFIMRVNCANNHLCHRHVQQLFSSPRLPEISPRTNRFRNVREREALIRNLVAPIMKRRLLCTPYTCSGFSALAPPTKEHYLFIFEHFLNWSTLKACVEKLVSQEQGNNGVHSHAERNKLSTIFFFYFQTAFDEMRLSL